jgi:hypothetical protein
MPLLSQRSAFLWIINPSILRELVDINYTMINCHFSDASSSVQGRMAEERQLKDKRSNFDHWALFDVQGCS